MPPTPTLDDVSKLVFSIVFYFAINFYVLQSVTDVIGMATTNAILVLIGIYERKELSYLLLALPLLHSFTSAGLIFRVHTFLCVYSYQAFRWRHPLDKNARIYLKFAHYAFLPGLGASDTEKRFSRDIFRRQTFHGVLGGLCILIAATTWEGILWSIIRLIACGTAVSLMVMLVDEVHILGLKLIGINIIPLWNMPSESKSVREFWGKRWNLGFHRTIKASFFEPVFRATGNRQVACLVAFAYSGIYHAIPLLWLQHRGTISPRLLDLVSMTSYFLLQAFFCAFIDPALEGRFWQLFVFVPLPLVFSPLLNACGIPLQWGIA